MEKESLLKEITIQLLQKCNFKCGYCFSPHIKDLIISDESFEYFYKFCQKECVECIHVTGGEPSLHPDFERMITELSNIASLVIYSNLGKPNILSERFRYDNTINFLVNINEKEFYKNNQLNVVKENIIKLKKLGIGVVIGHTFCSEMVEEEFQYILDFLDDMQLKKLRVSQALKNAEKKQGMGKNEIKVLYEYVKDNIENWEQRGFKIYFDCPVPPCYIGIDTYYFLKNKGILTKGCIPKAFIMPDLSVTHCYSTMDVMEPRNLYEFSSLEDLLNYSCKLIERKNIKRNLNKCDSCILKKETEICGCPDYII